MNEKAKLLIEKLSLEKHPEGGFFREVYRSDEKIPKDGLPERFTGERDFCTSIYFLLHDSEFSSFHKIKSDETWHFYEGSPVKIYMIDQSNFEEVTLGEDFLYQYTVKKGTWFASKVAVPDSYSLVGCTVAPGFDFMDFEIADRHKLLKDYPGYADVIRKMTR